MEEEANIFSRISGGFIILFVGFDPSYICGVLLYWLASGRENFSFGIIAAVLVSAAIAIPFYFLAFRVFTGKGRKKDGGLVSPYILLTMSVLIIVMGVVMGIILPSENIIKSIVGGGIFVLLGAGGVSLSYKRIKNA